MTARFSAHADSTLPITFRSSVPIVGAHALYQKRNNVQHHAQRKQPHRARECLARFGDENRLAIPALKIGGYAGFHPVANDTHGLEAASEGIVVSLQGA